MKQIILLILVVFSFRGFSQEASKLDNEKLLDFIQTQRYKEAAEYIKSVYPGVINDDKIISRLGYVYYMNGNLPEAEQNYLLLFKKDTLNKSILMNLASLNNRRGNYLVSTGYYRKILQIDSTIFNVYKQLADIGQITNDSNTVNYLKKANMLNPIDGDVAYDLGDLYIGKKNFKAADSVLKVALQADTTNLLLYRAKAKLAYATKDYKELITICEKLFNGGDHTPTVYKWMGNANFYLKSYRKSIDTFLELEKLEELEESALYMTAKSYKSLSDEKNAIDYYMRAIKAGTASSESVFFYYYELGDLYKSVKKPKLSVQAYEKSVQYQETPFAYYMLATIYDQELKNKMTALKYYRKYVSLTGREAEYNEYLTYARARISELLH